MTDQERNKETVLNLMEVFRTGNLDSVDEILVEGYIQHNPGVGTGRHAFKEHFAAVGPIDVEVHRMIAEGDFVVAHLHSKRFNSVFIDIFRLDASGRIVEHWDVAQEIPAKTVSGNDMFSQLS